MVDIDDKGGIQVFVKDLLDAGLLNGDVLTCTGESLEKQIQSLKPAKPDGNVIFSVESPFKPSGGLRVLGGNLSPEFSAVLKLAGVEGGLENNIFKGKAKIFDGQLQAIAIVEPRGKSAAITAEVSLEHLNTRNAVQTLIGQDRVTGPLSLSLIHI